MKSTLTFHWLPQIAAWLLVAALTLATTPGVADAQAADSLRSVTCLAVSPDGEHVVSGGGSQLIVHHWDDLRVVQTLKVPIAQVHDAQFSDDGHSLLLTGGTPAEFGTVVLLSWPQLQVKWSRQLSDDLLYAAAFVQKTNRIAAAGHDHAVYVFDAEGGVEDVKSATPMGLSILSSHSKPVTSVCVVNHSSLLASCSVDGTVRIWNESNGQLLRTLSNHLKAVRMIAARPDAESRLPMVASVSDDRTLRLWQPTIGRMVRFKRLDARASAVAWHAAADRVIVGARDGSVVAVNPDDLSVESLREAGDEWITELASHPTLRDVAVGTSDGIVKKLTLSE